MNLNSLFKDATPSEQDDSSEWGIFPPEPVGPSAIVPAVSDQRAAAASAPPAAEPAARQCRYCTETVPPNARECPLCLRAVDEPGTGRRTPPSIAALAPAKPLTATALVNPLPPAQTGSASMTPTAAITHAPAAATGGAVYTLEAPAQCPECDAEINTIHVIRVLRTQVSFTSTLPRKAYVVACPECRRLLSAGLSGVL
jgi:hypothetical protein